MLYVLILWIFLLFLPGVPYQLSPYIPLAVSVCGIFLIFSIRKKIPEVKKLFSDELKLKDTPILVSFSLMLIVAAVSVFFSLALIQSLKSFVFLISLLLTYLVLRIYPVSFMVKEKIAMTFVIMTFFLSCISLYNTLIKGYVNKEAEGVSFLWIYFGHNHISALLIFSIPITTYFLWKYLKKIHIGILFMIILCVLVFGFFYSYARGSFMSLICAFLLFAFYYKNKIRIVSPILVICILIVGIGFLVFNTKQFSFPKREPDINSRIVYWRQAVEGIHKRPLLGSGLNTFKIVNMRSPLKSHIPTYFAHNYFIQMLSDIGAIGFVLSIILILSSLIRGVKIVWQKTDRERLLSVMILVGIVGSTVNTLIDFDWQLPTVFFTYWFFSGIL